MDLSKYAFKNEDAIRIKYEKEDIRPPFFHDSDRIIYSKSFNRYVDKTQVFSYKDNDHITRRITHVIMVSKIARTIGRNLNLNEDLIEAISLGHDSGHTPLGHTGEKYLNEITNSRINEAFMHNIQSVRNYMLLEKNGEGLNLTIQVLDGIMCHNGEILSNIYYPISKTKEQFLDEYYNALKDNSVSLNMKPMTLEGCVVRISDVIAYVGRDVEDAISMGLIKREDIPTDITSVLGNKNSQIVDTLIKDVISNSFDKPYIMMSDKIYAALEKLKNFNYENIYNKANTLLDNERYCEQFNTLFDKYYNDIQCHNINSEIYVDFLNYMNNDYIHNVPNERKIIDFIAGMTDDYFLKSYNK